MATLEEELLEQARSLGFALVGIAAAEEADDFASLERWLEQGYAGEMGYMRKHAEARRHPRSILASVRSVIMVGLCYDAEPSRGSAKFARYARGADYHEVLRERLRKLGGWLRERRPEAWGRVVVDTAPLLERGFARRAGLGWIGKNTMLIHPRVGSWFVLGGLLVDIELTPTPSFERRHCGTCTACLDACPTGAFVGPGMLDARRCISYLTIELRQPVPEAWRERLDGWVFGCDVCQEVCPWNRKGSRGGASLAAREDLLAVDARELLGLSPEAFRARFEGTAIHPRPGRAVVLRNAALLLGSARDRTALEVLGAARNDGEELIREAVEWAIARIEEEG